MLAQPPDISLVTCQAGAVDTALLTSTDTNSLTVLDIANRVRLRIFQCNQGDNQVALSLCGEGLVLGGDVLKQSRVIQFDFVTSLFESHTKALLTFNGLGLVGRVNLDDVVSTLALVFQNLDGLSGKVGSNHTIAYLTLQEQGGSSIAGVAQRYKVAIARHTVGTTCSGISTGNSALVQSLHIIHEINLLQGVAQRKTYSSTCRADMLERGSSGQTSSLFQLLYQLPGVQCIKEVDVAWASVNHFDG